MKKNKNHAKAWLLSCLSLLAIPSAVAQTAALNTPTAGIYGEQRQWHQISVAFAGPNTNENATPNPFTNYRLDVTFTHPGGASITVPGYYAADGQASETSATAGNIWRVHFRPWLTGTWTYTASFVQGGTTTYISGGSANNTINGATGTINIQASNKTGRDFRAHGRLQYVNKHHLRHQGSGRYFLKFGADSPENPIAYADIDNTPVAPSDFRSGLRHNWQPHVADWNTGDPQWQGTKGRGLIGALNYLAGVGAHSWSTLVYSISGGDDRRIFPWTAQNNRVRFDCSKLDQWGIAFSHANNKGLNCSIKLAEEENWEALSGNNLRLQYREMVARYGHNLGVTWIISEEFGGFVGSNGGITNAEKAEIQERGDILAALDPWDNNLTTHTGANALEHNEIYGVLYGRAAYTGASMQIQNGATVANNTFNRTLAIRNASVNAGRPWVVANDEQGPANLGVFNQTDFARKHVIWANLMAGGAGTEFYVNNTAVANLDASIEDYRIISTMWNWADNCVNDFVYGQNIPFWDMANANNLTVGGAANWCLADAGNAYVVYMINGGTTSLNLSGQTGSFEVKWFNPRSGGGLLNGSIQTVQGGGTRQLGTAPNSAGSDWAILIRPSGGGGNPGGGATTNVLDCNSLTSSVVDGSSVTLSVDYEATASRDVVFAIWEGNTWRAGGRTTVAAGVDTASVTVNLDSATNDVLPGNYEIRALLWNVGENWNSPAGATPLNSCVGNTLTVTAPGGGGNPGGGATTNELDCTTITSSVVDGSSVTLSVGYEATASRDVVFAIWEGNTWRAGGRTTVAAGVDTASITVNLDSATNDVLPGNYEIRALLWNVGENWNSPAGATPLNSCVGNTLTVTAPGGGGNPGGGATTNELDCTTITSSVVDGSSVTLSVGYEATASRDVVFAIWEGNTWRAGGRTTVAAGVDTASITVNLDSATNDVLPGNYEIRALLWNVGENWNSPAGATPLNSCVGNTLTVTAPGGGGNPGGGGTPQTVNLVPAADVYIQNTTTFNDNVLRVESSGRVRTSYLRFNVTGVSGTVTGAKLRLDVPSGAAGGDAGTGTIQVFVGSGNAGWTEANITSGNAPAQGVELGSKTGTFGLSTTHEIDLTPAQIPSSGNVTLIVKINNTQDIAFSSKEGVSDPQLIITSQ